jgi:hypothetical protein
MRLPKNIASMTEDEHIAWVRSLSNEQHSEACDKTFCKVEYVVSAVAESGDVLETDYHDTLEEARKVFASFEYTGSVAYVLEKATGTYGAIDRDLVDRQYETLDNRGDESALTQGGFL